MAASTKASGVPNIDFSGERILKTNIRKYRDKDGMLKVCKSSEFELNQVRSILYSLASALINKGDTTPIILDTGSSISDTGFRDDFLEGTLVQL